MTVTLRVPASTSNLGSGFDCVGMAVDRWLTVTGRVVPGGGAVSLERSGTLGALAPEPDADLVVRGFVAACRAAGRQAPGGLVLRADSEIPVGRGLGASAAAIVAGAAVARALLGLPLDDAALIDVAAQLEGHPDNVAPAVRGGATLSVPRPGGGGYHVESLEVHPSLAFVFAVPPLEFAVTTERARAVLPAELPHAVAVTSAARAAALVIGLARGDRALLAAGLDDALHVPYRRVLVPGYDDVTAAAVRAGAWGATLSGSGSSILAVASRDAATTVADAMRSAWHKAGVAADAFSVTGRTGGCALVPGPASATLTSSPEV
ncbi:MAG TPA: homoserine kinase [Gemmatimonadales bacterium]